MKKILFFDIDGTLLSEKTHTVPQSTIDALKQAKANGHLIFINTGRPISTIDQCIKDLNPDGYVCGCGVYITYNNDVLLDASVPLTRCQEIIDGLKRHKIDGVLEGSQGVAFTPHIRHPFVKDIKKRYSQSQFPIKETDEHTTFDKFALWFDQESDEESFKKEINDFQIIYRDSDFWEIIPQGYSKATGIQFLLDYFHLQNDDAYVFGDSFNDEPMLAYVKHAIVMGNGDKELFHYAYLVTKDIEEDGLAYALQKLNLI